MTELDVKAEVAGTARKFGRLVEHDPRSRAYGLVVSPTTVPETRLWINNAPVLDQGSLGSCTGHAMAQWENVTRTTEGLAEWLTDSDAVDLYSEATKHDEFPGEYPPVDTGSSGLAVAKAAQAKGYISGYRHAFGFKQTLIALQISPVLVGTVWLENMNKPDDQLLLHVSGEELGGHEYLLVGCDVENEYVTILNSWSETWGEDGTARISFLDFEALLGQQGDVTVPVA
ncbi:hypothetical protein SEA_FORZA_111 [Gordonia phage Forza]|uniref:Peptidase C1A papain C-terminal domain-containing protein n=1 Tax=Gordonia phage Forza TaxID=2571247 RepID=A0A650EYH3_9CAUD|nr:peptidase [Gordonia phage Forza]QEM41578.1 hypothetical protein SEA_BOOPY_111 [Gordonia phage Boopy]QGT55104.1 hypothetical protein SEA_FORZA_111 [Gordonia phage Forza]UXE04252.1 cysteine protease [Gordonia phage BlueNGold]WBF03892.1 cysteine protease [Gordonia phage Mareelih]